jgi:peroxiredoxin
MKPGKWSYASAAVALAAAGLALLLWQGATSAEAPPRLAPDFTLTECVNADTLHLARLEAGPVLLVFYDGGEMSSCQALPYVNEWHRRYESDGLKVIGVHSPALEPLKAKYNAVEVISRAHYNFAVGMDHDRAVYGAYGLSALPAYVLVRPGGAIAFQTSAPRAYAEVEMAVQKLLEELKPGIVNPFLVKPMRPADDPKVKMLPATPEIRLGYEAGAVAGCDSTVYDRFYNFTDSRERVRGKVYLHGYWKVGPGSVAYEEKYRSSDDHLRMIYSGKEVWLLRACEYGARQKVYVKQDRDYLAPEDWGKDIQGDGLGRPFILLEYSIPASIIKNREYGTHELELIPAEGDGAFYYLFFEGEPAGQASPQPGTSR